METYFISLLNRSYQAAIVICFILIARLLFRLLKLPRKYTCMLWAIPLFRMAFPFSIESIWSLLPQKEPLLPPDIGYMAEPKIVTGSAYVDVLISQALPAATPEASVNPMQVWLFVMRIIWLAGVTAFLIYGIVSYLCLKRKLRCSICLGDNIFLADYIGTPFVLGIARPRIYLPSSLEAADREYVVAHEKMHIKRGDHFYKLAAFLITAWHWFNPLAWAAFALLGRDMETACDEAVMKRFGEGCRKDYARTLLDCAADKKLKGVPLAFSEGSPKERIRHILRYKKPLLGLSVFAAAAVILLAAGLISNPPSTDKGDKVSGQTEPEEVTPPAGKDDGWEETIAVTRPVLAGSRSIGADGMILDYADGRIMIFHGDFGLFVCDTQAFSIIGAVDLKAIGCDATQGDNYCEVSVAKDGSKVYLAPLSGNNMYVYDVSTQSLVLKPWDVTGIEMFDAFVSQSEFLEEYVGFRSERRAVITGDDGNVRYGYLSSAEGVIGDICYEETGYTGENEYDHKTYPIFADNLLSSFTFSMTAVKVSDTGIVFGISNHSEEELIFSDDFKLQRWEGDQWVDVPYIIDNGAFNQPAYPVEAGGYREAENDWEWLYGKLPEGVYLFTKSISIEKADGTYSHTSLGVQFTLPMQGNPPESDAGQLALFKAYISQEGVESRILLATDGTYDYEGSQAGLFVQVYILNDAGEKSLGSISSTGTAYPVRYDKSGIYVGGGHFVARYIVDEKEERLILAESVSISYDEEGNPSYYGVVADDPRKEEQELTEEDFTALSEKYGKAKVVNFAK